MIFEVGDFVQVDVDLRSGSHGAFHARGHVREFKEGHWVRIDYVDGATDPEWHRSKSSGEEQGQWATSLVKLIHKGRKQPVRIGEFKSLEVDL